MGNKNSVKVLNILLRNGCDINAVDDDDMTLLHYIAESKKEGINELLKTVLCASVDPLPCIKGGKTPLDIAITEKMLEKVKIFSPFVGVGALAKAAHIGDKKVTEFINDVVNNKRIPIECYKNIKNASRTNVFEAPSLNDEINAGNFIEAKYLLRSNANPRISYFETGFEAACKAKDLSVIQEMVSILISPDEPDAKGNTLLHYATLPDNFDADIILYLVEAGASFAVENIEGVIPMDNLAGSVKRDSLAYLRDKGLKLSGKDYSFLKSAIRINNNDAIEYALDLDIKDENPEALLELALTNQIEDSDDYRQFMRQLASIMTIEGFEAYFRIPSLLMKAKLATIATTENVIETLAKKRYYLSVFFCLLLGCKMKPSESAILHSLSGIFTKTPYKPGMNKLEDFMIAKGYILHLAVVYSPLDVVERLINKGIDIDIPDLSGRRPIDLALKWGRFDAVKLLINEGCNLTPLSFECPTFLHGIEISDIALGKKKIGADVEKALKNCIKAIPDLSVQMETYDRNGDTPLDFYNKKYPGSPIHRILMSLLS